MIDDDGNVRITRSFCVFIERDLESEGGPGEWVAHIIGPDGLDNYAWADDPVDALYMTLDLLRLMTDKCKPLEGGEHVYEIDTTYSWPDNDEVIPMKKCSRCGTMKRASEFQEKP